MSKNLLKKQVKNLLHRFEKAEASGTPQQAISQDLDQNLVHFLFCICIICVICGLIGRAVYRGTW
jgi:hypothetical protein